MGVLGVGLFTPRHPGTAISQGLVIAVYCEDGHTPPMRITTLILLALLSAATLTPAQAQMCDTRCDEGEVWTEAEGGTCMPEPKPMS